MINDLCSLMLSKGAGLTGNNYIWAQEVPPTLYYVALMGHSLEVSWPEFHCFFLAHLESFQVNQCVEEHQYHPGKEDKNMTRDIVD